MNRDDVFYLGDVVKVHGFKGELGLKLDVDDPSDYKRLESVFVEINNELVPFFVDRIQIKHKGLAVVKFEGVDSEDDARILVKSKLFLPLEVLPPLEGNKFYFHEVIGFKVTDTQFGEVGTVVSINDEAAQPLMFVATAQDQEVIVPLIDSVITELKRDQEELVITAPEGLIAFYLSESEK